MADSSLQATLDTLLAERAELDVAISVIAKRLGIDPPRGGGGLPLAHQGSNVGGRGGDPVAGTSEGEYFSFVSTKAALEVLKKFGSRQHPLKTKDIYDAIKKGGVDISNEDSLYRSLSRSHRFRKVGRGLWGLTEWYPAQQRKPKVDAQGKPLVAEDDTEVEEMEDFDVPGEDTGEVA